LFEISYLLIVLGRKWPKRWTVGLRFGPPKSVGVAPPVGLPDNSPTNQLAVSHVSAPTSRLTEVELLQFRSGATVYAKFCVTKFRRRAD